MTTEEEKAAPATKADIEAEQWSINVTTLIATGGAVGTLIVTLLIGGWIIMREARAEGRTAGELAAAPLVLDVALLKQQVPFLVAEQREQRTEFRAFVDKGPWATELKRPMAPLPPLALDAGQ